ncbi:hypothetical protein, partial [Halorubrum sp. Atlit-28R]|uniref:hypothetical protein n=1 Tax=Halorubrum sp. Atlit-28R TaxID=2282129 RepID=UPI000EF278F5
IDVIKEKLSLKTDGELADLMEVPATLISKIRNNVIPVGPTTLIRMHEVSGMGIKEMKRYLYLPNNGR